MNIFAYYYERTESESTTVNTPLLSLGEELLLVSAGSSAEREYRRRVTQRPHNLDGLRQPNNMGIPGGTQVQGAGSHQLKI